MQRSKRPPRGNGNRNPEKTAGHPHPLYHPLGSYWWKQQPCRILRHYPATKSLGERFRIVLSHGLEKTVPKSQVLKQPHPPRQKPPFTQRRRLGT